MLRFDKLSTKVQISESFTNRQGPNDLSKCKVVMLKVRSYQGGEWYCTKDNSSMTT